MLEGLSQNEAEGVLKKIDSAYRANKDNLPPKKNFSNRK